MTPTTLYLDTIGRVLARFTHRREQQPDGSWITTALEQTQTALPALTERLEVDFDRIYKGFAHNYHQRVTGDGTEPDHYDLVFDLDQHKTTLMHTVDTTAETRIHRGPGFEFPPDSGLFFSLSANAQTKWNGLVNADLLGMLDYDNDPPAVRTTDDQTEVMITDSATLRGMWGSAMMTIRHHLDACRLAKGAIYDATTKADADTAFDAYMGD